MNVPCIMHGAEVDLTIVSFSSEVCDARAVL
jgi:hypothetical protein